MALSNSPKRASRNTRPAVSRLALLLLIGLCLVFVSSYTNRLVRKAQVDQEIKDWEQRIAEAENRQLELLAELDYVESEAYIGDVARNELDMAKPGDTVIIVVDDFSMQENSVSLEDAGDSISPTRKVHTGDPTWMQWVSIFVGDE